MFTKMVIPEESPGVTSCQMRKQNKSVIKPFSDDEVITIRFKLG